MQPLPVAVEGIEVLPASMRARLAVYRLLVIFVCCAFLLSLATTPAAALEVRTAPDEANGLVAVAHGETVTDSLIAAGETVQIDGDVSGNLIALARRVVVSGNVGGDLVTAAQTVELTGTVQGNVLSFSRRITAQGDVANSLHSFAEHVELESDGQVQGDFIAFASEIASNGSVGRDLIGFGGLTEIGGSVGNDLKAYTGQLSVRSSARIGGDLTAHVGDAGNLRIDPGATIAGKVETVLPGPKATASKYTRPGFYLWQLLWLVAAFVTGLVLFGLFPGLFARFPATGGELARSLGVGFLVLIATPVAALLAAITIIGLPLGMLTLAGWLAGLYLAWVLAAFCLGQLILRAPDHRLRSFALALLLGLFLLIVVANVPYLGGFVRLAAILFGLGWLTWQLLQFWPRRGTVLV